MLKKSFIFLMCIFALFYVWISSSTAIFSKYSKTSEVYLYKNNSCGQILNIKNQEMPLQLYKYGEACNLKKEGFSLEDVLKSLDAKILWTETTDCGTSYYAYSKKLKYSCVLKGQKISLQIFVGKEEVKLASPIIYGSY